MTALRRRLLEDMQVRQLSPHTQRTDVNNIAQFARDVGQSPDALGPEAIRASQVYVTTDRKLAPSSVCMAVSALRFLDRVTLKKPWRIETVIPTPKQPQTVPVVLSPEDVVQTDEDVADLEAQAAAGLVERFRRLDADTLLYEFTMDDPTAWTMPWRVEMTMTRSDGALYEYACHEGNYGLFNILAGARTAEDAAQSGSR